MEENVIMERLLELLKEKKYREFKKALVDMNEADIAEFIDELDAESACLAFRLLPKAMATDVFAELDSDAQEHIISEMSDSDLQYIIEDLSIDDAVDMLEELPPALVVRVLENATADTRKQINEILKYPENSAGSIMTVEYIGLKKTMTVKEAFDYIRKYGTDKETIYTCYVMGDYRVLEGVVTVKEMLMSSYDVLIEEIMDTKVIKADTLDHREDIVKIFNKYGFLSVPVVDHDNRLVGIVTIDDAMDVMEEEATEDFEKMAAMNPSEKPYLKTGVFEIAKNRIMWLLFLMISAMITGGILSKFEQAISAMPILVSFIPMLTDTGGNAGSQSSTMVIRGMAVGEIELKDALKVLWKELRVAVIVGTILAIIDFIKIVVQYPGKYLVGMTVALSMFMTVMLANLAGGVLPVLAKKLKLDPAIMAAPLISTLVDAMSLLIFFTIAVNLLKL